MTPALRTKTGPRSRRQRRPGSVASHYASRSCPATTTAAAPRCKPGRV